MRLWIDTDIGDNPDDTVALLAAAGHPGIEIVGISTSGSQPRASAEIVQQLFADIARPAPLIYSGAPDPRALAAAEAMMAIGPLTNLAGLLRAGVELPPTTVMGGALRPVEHRPTGDWHEVRATESNFAADPAAAALVVAYATDLLLVTLDVTAAMVVAGAAQTALDAIAAAVPTLHAHADAWAARGNAVCLHDPLALLALNGECVRIERRSLAVTVEGRLVEPGADAVEHDVVVTADVAAALRRILDLAASSVAAS